MGAALVGSHLPVAGTATELVIYLILFVLAQFLILYLYRWINHYVAGRNERMFDELMIKDVKQLIDLRNAVKRNHTRWNTHENRWLIAMINKAIDTKVQNEVERRNSVIQQQLAARSQVVTPVVEI